ncbi:MAG: glycoside hydrolase 100 family protein [Candidatus Pacearchaeota archaeon]
MNIDKRVELEECYSKAKEVIKLCTIKEGLFASGGKDGYNAIWARDSIISLIGASVISDDFKKTFENNLNTLSRYQSRLGQIPNAIDIFSERKHHVDFQTIDSTLWYLIGHIFFKKRFGSKLFNSHKKSIQKALTWLEYQDWEEDGLLEQLPTTDWQDAFPHKYGHVISTIALYYKVLMDFDKKRAEKIKKLVNRKEEVKLWNGEFYWAYRWKNHNSYREIGEWFDSFGNVLSIIYGLANRDMSNKIIDYIKTKNIDSPFPLKSIFPPIYKTSKYWQDYYLDCDAKEPYNYLNGGIWPFIGGFYIIALIKEKRIREAEEELIRLAKINLIGNFPEWVNPLDSRTYGELQAWSAGMYIAAFDSLKLKKVLI